MKLVCATQILKKKRTQYNIILICPAKATVPGLLHKISQKEHVCSFAQLRQMVPGLHVQHKILQKEHNYYLFIGPAKATVVLSLSQCWQLQGCQTLCHQEPRTSDVCRPGSCSQSC